MKNTETQRHRGTKARIQGFFTARLCASVSLCLCVFPYFALVRLASPSKDLDPISDFQLGELFADNNSFVPNKAGGNEDVAADFLLDDDGLRLNLFIDDNVDGLSRFALQDGSLGNDKKPLILPFGLRRRRRFEEGHSGIHVGADEFVGLRNLYL